MGHRLGRVRCVGFALALAASTAGAQLRGDFDNDGRWTPRDAEAALQMSLGLRPPLPHMDVDGDGRVLSSDARLILGGKPGTGAKPDSGATPPPAGGEEFFVIFQNGEVTNLNAVMAKALGAEGGGGNPAAALDDIRNKFAEGAAKSLFDPANQGNPKALPADEKAEAQRVMRDMIGKIRRADADDLEVKVTNTNNIIVLRVSGAGLGRYQRDMFPAGSKYSSKATLEKLPMTAILATMPKDDQEAMAFLKDKVVDLPYALFFTTEKVVSRKELLDEIRENDPDADIDEVLKAAAQANRANGTFTLVGPIQPGVDLTVLGGALQRGWTDDAKRHQIEAIAVIFELCATEIAMADDGEAEEKLAALRRFRDEVLANSPPGRFGIEIYYKLVSPAATRQLAKGSVAGKLWERSVDLSAAAATKFFARRDSRATGESASPFNPPFE